MKLVAKAEGPAGLMIAGPRPDAAAEVLIEEPAVHQQIERVVGRADLHRAEGLIPAPRHDLERRARRRNASVAADQAPGVPGVLSLAEKKDQAQGLARGKADRDLQRRARIEAGAEAPGERTSRESRRLAHIAREGSVERTKVLQTD